MASLLRAYGGASVAALIADGSRLYEMAGALERRPPRRSAPQVARGAAPAGAWWGQVGRLAGAIAAARSEGRLGAILTDGLADAAPGGFVTALVRARQGRPPRWCQLAARGRRPAPLARWLAGREAQQILGRALRAQAPLIVRSTEAAAGGLRALDPRGDAQALVVAPVPCDDSGGPAALIFGLPRAHGAPRAALGAVRALAALCGDALDRLAGVARGHRADARALFVNMAAHELSAPVASALLHTRLLEGSMDGGGAAAAGRDGVQDRVASVRQELERLADLVEFVRAAAYGAYQGASLVRAPADLADLVGRTIAAARERYGDALDVRLSIGKATAGRWNVPQIEGAVANLVCNAVKYGAGRPIDVQVDGARQGVVVRVTDRGPGIARADRRRIFARYHRGCSGPGASAMDQPGLGLGLWLVRRIVGAHGGRVKVLSRLGEGSTFELWLPRT